MKLRLPLLFLLGLAACAAPGKTEPARPIDRLAWDVITEWDSGETAMDRGYKTQGRFRRGEGIRIKTTVMGSAHGMGHGAPPGPNSHLLIFAPDHVAVTFSVLSFESGENTESLPHLLLRARKGEPDHRGIDPRLVPGPNPALFYFDEPILSFELDPDTMFGHEPGLEPEGYVERNGKKCRVMRSIRSLEKPAMGGWYLPTKVVKRFYIEEPGGLAGMETILETPAGTGVLRADVVQRQTFGNLELPSVVQLVEEWPGRVRRGRHRVILDPGDT